MVATKKELIRWEVEWLSDLPVDGCGDADWDRATYQVRHFPGERGKGLAVACARRVLRENPNLPVQEVRIHRQEGSIDADMWEHERLKRMQWVNTHVGYLWEPTDELILDRTR